MEQRQELMAERHILPSRYWEPQPDEDDLARLEEEYRQQHMYEDDDEELPFV